MTGYWVVFCFLVCGELLVRVNAEVPIAECDCKGDGTCSFDESGDLTCDCGRGFAKKADGLCYQCDCKGDGTCSFDDSGALTCDCGLGFDKKVDGLCYQCDCKGDGTCSFDESGDLTCDCGPGFAKNADGLCYHCDCGVHGNCNLVQDIKSCTCEIGYANNQGICEACDCGTKGTCSFDDIGQKVCKCNKQNAVKNGKCEFCYCGEKGKCSFVGENKQCLCDEGYAEDKDQTGECKECDCGDGTKTNSCTFNKEGKKVCDCLSMYADKNGICTVCYCGEKGKCSFVGENKECSCEEGYVEDKDQTGECKADPCASNPCKNDGLCTVINSTDYLCECKQPFSGNHCERHPCLSNPCLNDGTCIAVENINYGCVCDEPFYGRHCENDPCTPSPCKNEGLCEVVGIDFNCTCKSPYFGKQCEIEIDTTEEDTTVSDRITTGPVTTNKTECYCGENSVSCRLNWMGEKLCFCKEGYDQRRGKETCSRICQSNADCYNDGICDRDSSGYFCLCRGTFIGDQCELDVCNSVKFECRSKGAECVRQGTFGVCECPRGKKMSLYNYCEDICTYDTCVYGTCELTGYNFSQYVCNCYEGYYGSRCENALVIHYTPAITILVILASAIVLFSITSIVAGCWVKKLRKKIAENTKQTGQP